MKRHAITLLKRACYPLLFCLCWLSGNVAYADYYCLQNGEQIKLENRHNAIDKRDTNPFFSPNCGGLESYYNDVEGRGVTSCLVLIQRHYHNRFDLILNLNIGYYFQHRFIGSNDGFFHADGFSFFADGNIVMERWDIDFEASQYGKASRGYQLWLTSKDIRDIAAIRKVALSKKTILRLYGKDNPPQDFELTDNQKLAMWLTLVKFDELKGKQ